MTVTINGATGIAGVDGTAVIPAMQGSDTNTGVFYGTDIVAISTGGTERMRINASGQAEFAAGTAALPTIATTGDTNTGIYFPAADQVGLTAGGSQVLLVTASGSTVTGTESVSGNLSFNSGYGSAAVAYGCRAWVNFNGTGTVAIRASGNVTSITDNGVGDYTMNFTTAMPDVNYAAVCNSSRSDTANGSGNLYTSAAVPTAAAVRLVAMLPTTATSNDQAYFMVAIFR
jgi:hypothetical protein